MKVLFVFGTRPEAIKLAPVIKELSRQPNFDCKICVTGQHREMLAQVLELFDLRPDWNLDLMRPNQDLAHLTGAALSGVGEVLGIDLGEIANDEILDRRALIGRDSRAH